MPATVGRYKRPLGLAWPAEDRGAAAVLLVGLLGLHQCYDLLPGPAGQAAAAPAARRGAAAVGRHRARHFLLRVRADHC